MAEVIQDDLPRDNIDVVRFRAPNPRIGPARKVRVRRRGKTAVVTWRKAVLAKRYDVVVEQGDGSRALVPVTGRRLRVVVRGVAKREGVRVRVTAISARGRSGRRPRNASAAAATDAKLLPTRIYSVSSA